MEFGDTAVFGSDEIGALPCKPYKGGLLAS
jgi:hypothetical protein